MKKIIITFLMILLSYCLFAQQNKVLYELFTEVSCKFCPRANKIIDSLVRYNSGKLLSMKYQTNFLSDHDMNSQDSAEVNWRYDKYYKIDVQHSVPRGKPDGVTIIYNIPEFFTQQTLDSLWNLPKPFQLNLTHVFKADYDSVKIKLNIKSLANQHFQTGKLRARIALIEDSIIFNKPPGSNGEYIFRNVMRKLIPDTAGFVIKSNWANNELDSAIINFPVPKYLYDLNSASFVAFIQYDSTKYVIQSVKSPSIKLADYAVIDRYGSLNFSKVICADTLKNVKVKVINRGTNNLTSFDLIYKLDNDAPVPFHINDNILPGQSKEFSLPDVPDTVGQHTYSVRVANPNGHVYNNFDNVFKVSSTFIMKKQAMNTPLFENFQGGFPPQGWLANNLSKTSQIWQKNYNPMVKSSTYLKIYENIFPGIANELIMPIFDLSGLSQCHLGFEVANAYGLGMGQSGDSIFNYDTLMVVVSKDCGNNWDTVYNKNGPNLATKGHIDSFEILPSSSDWRLDTINLAPYVGYSKVIIKFIGISGGGNDLYLTNINIGEHLSIKQNNYDNKILVFPNPSAGVFSIIAENLKCAEVYNLTGTRVFYLNNPVSDNIKIDISENPKGMYIMKLVTLNGVQTVKLIVN